MELRSDIIDALPWVDYKAVHEKILAEGRAEGKAVGRAVGFFEVAADLFCDPAIVHDQLEKSLLAGGVPALIVAAAREVARVLSAEKGAAQEPHS